ncbi:MAG TPA: amino acid adenylation domain-containing protein, partial [Longimicrobium sp.]
GHSLLAVRVVSRVRQALGVEAELGDLFVRPVLAEFARGLATARAALPPIVPAERDGPTALSFAQQRLWFLEELGGAGPAYHIPASLRLYGPLDRDALGRALDRIVERHEALRTTFAEVDGRPVQRVAPREESGFPLAEHDLRGDPHAEDTLRRLLAEEAGAPFDLARGPLARGRLVRMGDDDHALLVTMHHIVADGWSMGVLTRELSALYGAFSRGAADPLPRLPVQYADYAAWQRKWVDGEVLREQADYWKRMLTGAPPLLELPTDRPRPAVQDHAGAFAALELDEELTAALKALSQRHGATLYMTLLAGWAALLGRLSGQGDVVIGSPTANRGRSEIEGLIGFFVNTLALRVDLTESPTVAELLARVKERALGAQRHQDIPFEQVVELVQPARSMAHAPLYQAAFAWQNTADRTLELPGLTLGSAGAAAQTTSKFDITLALQETGGRIIGGVEYATALFDAATVERWMGYLRTVLRAMAADDARPVGTLPLLPDEERRRVVEEWNDTDAEIPGEPFHGLFEAWARRTPGAVALVQDGESLTYAELDARATRLARHLRGRGVGPEARVAICVERSPEMVVALLAVLKAGGAFVPLDPAYPVERLRYMIRDSAPTALLVDRVGRESVGGSGVPLVDLDGDGWPDAPDRGRPAVGPRTLAYVIYTSGSTGKPKGTMVEHGGVAALVAAQGRTLGVGPGSRVLQFASFSFDASVYEVAMALCHGASLHLPPRRTVLAGEALATMVGEHAITHATLPPAVLATMADEETLGSVGVMVLAGDVVTGAVARRWSQGRRLLNAYGPTEATVWSTVQEVGADDAGEPAIGRPIANTRVYVLDAGGEPVPVGVAGELYIGGAGVARGYLGRPALTAERFVADRLGGRPGARLYRTGDLGRWLPDGTIEFLGRADFQVKVRGFRVEPGEIEARLCSHPGVRDAVVVVRADASGGRRLVAYFAGSAPAEVLRGHLADHLPEHMVPSAFVRLEALPVTPNGKVDRRALPEPEPEAHETREYAAPVGEVERALAEIWGEMLGLERVGRNDHFFELGGHSLLAAQAVSRARRVLGAELALADLFTHPTPAALARRVAGGAAEPDADRAVAVRAGGAGRPLFVAHEGTGSVAYAQLLRAHLDAGVPVYALPDVPSTGERPRTIEGLAARLVRMIREVQPEGPYRLAGWSMGGLLAYEAATQLLAEDEEVELVAMMDTHLRSQGVGEDGLHDYALVLRVLRMEEGLGELAPALLPELASAASTLELDGLVAWCHAAGVLPAHVPAERAGRMLGRLRANRRALREYVPQPIPAPVHLFPAQEGPDPSDGWRALVRGLEVTPVPGNHLSMMDEPGAVAVGAAISGALAGGSPAARPGQGYSPLLRLRSGRAGAAPLLCVPGAGA